MEFDANEKLVTNYMDRIKRWIKLNLKMIDEINSLRNRSSGSSGGSHSMTNSSEKINQMLMMQTQPGNWTWEMGRAEKMRKMWNEFVLIAAEHVAFILWFSFDVYFPNGSIELEMASRLQRSIRRNNGKMFEREECWLLSRHYKCDAIRNDSHRLNEVATDGKSAIDSTRTIQPHIDAIHWVSIDFRIEYTDIENRGVWAIKIGCAGTIRSMEQLLNGNDAVNWAQSKRTDLQKTKINYSAKFIRTVNLCLSISMKYLWKCK